MDVQEFLQWGEAWEVSYVVDGSIGLSRLRLHEVNPLTVTVFYSAIYVKPCGSFRKVLGKRLMRRSTLEFEVKQWTRNYEDALRRLERLLEQIGLSSTYADDIGRALLYE